MRPDGLAPGTLIDLRQRRWRVCRLVAGSGCVRIDVTSRNRRSAFLPEFERFALAATARRPVRVRPQHAVARLALCCAREGDTAWVGASVRAAFAPLPYQLEPAAAMACGVRRVLIADEVGLGKTIQAGLVIAHRLLLEPDARVLVLTPAGLRDQWSDELRHRFGIRADAADRAGLDAAGHSGAFGANPWHRRGVWIATLDFIKQPHVRAGLSCIAWDLVVVDEAHDVSGDSDRHDVCAAIARLARRLVLLTATPHSGDETNFNRLVSLGALTPNGPRMLVWRRSRVSLGLGRTRVVRRVPIRLALAAKTMLGDLSAFERAMEGRTTPDRQSTWPLLAALLRKRAMSTFVAFARTVERRRLWLETRAEAGLDAEHWQQLTLGFDVPGDVMSSDDLRGVTARSGLDLEEELPWLRRLERRALDIATADPKIARVRALLDRTTEPAVIFTEYADSLDALRSGLPSHACACLHGNLGSSERRAALDDFLQGRVRVLLATDVGGQGLNLQTRARWVLNLELPWNPNRLEQRAGRVDRIGQTSRAHVTLLIADDEAERAVLARLTFRAQAAEDTVGHGASFRRAGARWRAVGEGLARDLTRRRALLHATATPRVVDHTRPCASQIRSLPLTRLACDAAVLVFSVPVGDREGQVLWVDVVVVAAPAGTPAGAALNHLQEAEAAARDHAAKAVRRLSARLARRAARDRRVNFEMLQACERLRLGPGLQPGLFDQRAVREHERAGRRVADLRRELAQRCEAAGPLLTPGRPMLEVVLCPRR